LRNIIFTITLIVAGITVVSRDLVRLHPLFSWLSDHRFWLLAFAFVCLAQSVFISNKKKVYPPRKMMFLIALIVAGTAAVIAVAGIFLDGVQLPSFFKGLIANYYWLLVAAFALLTVSVFVNKENYVNMFYLPALVLFFIFVLYPFIDGIRISFTNWNGYLPGYSYVGLGNYKVLFSDKMMSQVFFNTIIYGFGSTLFQNIIGLTMAIFLNNKFRGRGLLRTVCYLPVMIAPLIMGYILFYFFQYSGGALNDLVKIFGAEAVDWLKVPSRTVPIIMIVNTLQYMGVSMVIYLAGLKNIPGMYYEAASIDGVGNWEKFRRITLPLLMPAIASSVTINLIGGLKLFDIIRALLSDAPSTGAQSLSVYLTYQYFNRELAGYSAAIGVFTFLFILAVSILTIKYFDKREVVM
jgi:raffinose/stachyose/melibiose transport system permease protein